jgi:hypothetical protein
MEYMVTAHFTSENNDFPGNTPDAVKELIEKMLPYMVDNVEVFLTKTED